MAQSLSQILVHLVFSTKNRDALLADDIRDELHAYIGGIVENHKGTLLKAGSVADHIHLLIAHPRTCAPAHLRTVRSGSGNQDGFVQMAEDSGGAIQHLPLAEWLRDFLYQSHPSACFGAIHRQTGRASSQHHVSGRISILVEQERHPI